MTGAQSLMNPCTLFDFVRDNVRKSAQKGKAKFGSFSRLVNRDTLVRCAMPSLRDGISLYRTLFVLQETTNLTVFLDQNKDDLYSNTALRNYSHYYIRAGEQYLIFIHLRIAEHRAAMSAMISAAPIIVSSHVRVDDNAYENFIKKTIISFTVCTIQMNNRLPLWLRGILCQ